MSETVKSKSVDYKGKIRKGLYKFGKAIIPERFAPHLRGFFQKAGYSEVPYFSFSVLFLLSAVITLFLLYYNGAPLIRSKLLISASGVNLLRNPVMLILFTLSILGYWLAAQSFIVITFFLIGYIYYDLKIYRRTKDMERALPLFLSSMSENLKGGLSIEKALWLSIRPDMKDLAIEMRLTAKRVMVGTPVQEALMDLANRYDSPEMKRAFSLINEGIKNGSNIAFVIDRLVESMDKTKNLREEMISTNTSYMIFIAMIVLFIMPLLFAISAQLITIIRTVSKNPSIQSAQSGSGAASMGMTMFSMKSVGISNHDYLVFSYTALIISSAFAGVLMSLILYGNVKGGVKYIFLFMIVSVIVYYFTLGVFNVLFKSFMPSFG